MDFRIRWTLPAADDFENLAKKIEEKSDLVEARKVALEINDAVEGLGTHPYMGQALADYPQLRHRIVSSFKVIHRVFEESSTVEIVRILHQRQNLSEHLGGE
ncbi:MAG: type II toxin-antitoxin system RelE/ParE family toxin [Vulcanimicrobiota bacterium]